MLNIHVVAIGNKIMRPPAREPYDPDGLWDENLAPPAAATAAGADAGASQPAC
ncbi:MAG: hypothetical protein OD918_06515 [Gammaproteobacteria bacterium]